MTLNTALEVKISGQQAETLDLGGRVADIIKKVSKAFADGAGADQATKIHQDSVSLAGGATHSMDLDAGTLLGPFGTALAAFSKIRAILIVAGANPDDLNVAGDFALTALVGGFVDDAIVLKVKPGGVLLMVAPDVDGFAVTASTGDVLTVTNADGAVAATFDIIVLGS